MSFFLLVATSLKTTASKAPLPKLNTTANTRTLQHSSGHSSGDSTSHRNSGISPLASLALSKPVNKVSYIEYSLQGAMGMFRLYLQLYCLG